MKNTEKQFNIYCDESRVENKDSNTMVIGAIIIPREKKMRIIKKIKKIFIKHDFKQELKWIKTSPTYKNMYKELIDYFISEESVQFRCIVVNKNEINLEKYHNNDLELAFFKFYYLMLKQRLLDNNKYYIFLDKKPTRDKNRARALRSVLNSHILSKYTQERLLATKSQNGALKT